MTGFGWVNTLSTRHLRPLTDVGTARQKVQRSFAQEFLCPVEGVKQLLSLPDPSDTEIEAAAEHFEVSDYTMRTMPVNRGLVDRKYLPRR